MKLRVYLHSAARADLAIVVDQWQRPAELIERHPLIGLRRVPHVMKAQRDCEVSEVLLRALTREAPLRFDPIAVIDELGHYTGVVRVDRLVRESLDASAAARHHPSPVIPNAQRRDPRLLLKP